MITTLSPSTFTVAVFSKPSSSVTLASLPLGAGSTFLGSPSAAESLSALSSADTVLPSSSFVAVPSILISILALLPYSFVTKSNSIPSSRASAVYPPYTSSPFASGPPPFPARLIPALSAPVLSLFNTVSAESPGFISTTSPLIITLPCTLEFSPKSAPFTEPPVYTAFLGSSSTVSLYLPSGTISVERITSTPVFFVTERLPTSPLRRVFWLKSVSVDILFTSASN